MTIPKEIEKLSYKKTDLEQQSAIDYFTSIGKKYLPYLIQWTGKSEWRNVIKIIELVGSPENHVALSTLMTLLQDLNWPGANEALALLIKVDKIVLLPFLEKALLDAKRANDTIWIVGLKKIVQQKEIIAQDFLQPSTYAIIDLAEW